MRFNKVYSVAVAMLACAGLSPAVQAQVLLPNGQQQFVDGNGVPLAGGKVYFYVPGTTTAKTTWQDQGETVANTDPVVLDAAGRATIWGTGLYRELVYDANGNLVWDQITGEENASSNSAPLGGFGELTALASSATTDLGQVASHNVQITGTTAITSFGTSAVTSAPIYLIQFTGELTLTYNATSMILPSSASIQTAAGDVALAEYTGSGNWQVLEYYRVSGAPLINSISQHEQVFTASGTFTTPSDSSLDTLYEFDVTGGGGGGAATTAGYDSGGAGATGKLWISGVAPSTAVTVTVGAGGTGSSSTANSGTASSVTIGATTYTADGGGGGSTTGAGPGSGGSASGFTINLAGGTGQESTTATARLNGGSTVYGSGSYGSGGFAAGGSGSYGTGGNGIVVVKWVQ